MRACRFEIVDDEGDVTVAVAELVRLGAAFVDRQLDLEIVLGVLADRSA